MVWRAAPTHFQLIEEQGGGGNRHYSLLIERNQNTIDIQLVGPTKACGKVLSIKTDLVSIKTPLLLINIIAMTTKLSFPHKRSPLCFTSMGF